MNKAKAFKRAVLRSGRKGTETFVSRKRALIGAAGAAVGGFAGGRLSKKNKDMKKKAGIPAAILGGLTGAIPPVGMAYGALLGLHRGERKKMLNKLTEKEQKEVQKTASTNVYLDKVAELIEKIAGIGDIGRALIKSKIAPDMAGASGRGLERVARGVLGHKVNAKPLSGELKAKTQAAIAEKFKKYAPSVTHTPDQQAKIMAVAGRAKRMGVV